MLAGSVTALVAAALTGSALGLLSKAACRAGAWNIGIEQFQAHCYTDIYPLYFTEGLSAGKVPYLGHPVEYPVLIGAAMQAAAPNMNEYQIQALMAYAAMLVARAGSAADGLTASAAAELNQWSCSRSLPWRPRWRRPTWPAPPGDGRPCWWPCRPR